MAKKDKKDKKAKKGQDQKKFCKVDKKKLRDCDNCKTKECKKDKKDKKKKGKKAKKADKAVELKTLQTSNKNSKKSDKKSAAAAPAPYPTATAAGKPAPSKKSAAAAATAAGGKPVVSVLVPVYNVEEYLPQCLDSILAQTYTDLQIICINDGSTDSSPAILKDYAARDARIQVIDKPNGGYGDSMNAGLAAATGTYVGIVESDDFIEPGMYAAYVAAAEATGADIVKSNYFEYTEQEGGASNRRMDLFEGMDLPYDQVIDPREHRQIVTVRPSIWSALYRRSLIEDNGIRFSTTPGAAFQDTSFVHLCFVCAHSIVLLRQAFLHYRIDSSGSSSHTTDKVYLVCDEFDRSLDFLRAREGDHPGDLQRLGSALGALRMGAYSWNYYRIAPEVRQEFAERWLQDMQELSNDALLDFSLLRDDSLELLQLLAEDPAKFVKKCDSGEYWIYYRYEPVAPDPFGSGPLRLVRKARARMPYPQEVLSAVAEVPKKAAGAVAEGSQKVAGAVGQVPKAVGSAVAEAPKKAAGAVGQKVSQTAASVAEKLPNPKEVASSVADKLPFKKK